MTKLPTDAGDSPQGPSSDIGKLPPRRSADAGASSPLEVPDIDGPPRASSSQTTSPQAPSPQTSAYQGRHAKPASGSVAPSERRSVSTHSKHAKRGTVVSEMTDPVTGERILKVRKKRRKTPRGRQILVGILVAVLAVVLVAAGLFFILYHQGDRQLHVQENDVSITGGRTVSYNGHTYIYNENMVSILVLGFDRANFAVGDEESGQADAIAVLALDTSTGKTTLIGIPRDTMVDVDTYVAGAYSGVEKLQVCLAYYYGDGGTTSCENTARSVQRILFNLPVTYYFSLDMNGVGPLTDALGGVTLTALETMPEIGAYEGEDITLNSGNALTYVRKRDTSLLESSLLRLARQEQFCQAYAVQALAAAQGDVDVLANIYNTVTDYSVTNLNLNHFIYLATSLVQNGIQGIDVVTLPGEMTYGGKYAEFHTDHDGVYQVILDTFYTMAE